VQGAPIALIALDEFPVVAVQLADIGDKLAALRDQVGDGFVDPALIV